ncbi:hypothetical protein [uncultured Croceitalea sp.]|uniref:hypothetical protein n=1 Tax=uncultured Croceitalea sp. TaxID=1798908 RepID=UPI00374FC4BC
MERNLIQFEYNDGRKVRLSFAIGAEGDNIMDTDMLFIGGNLETLGEQSGNLHEMDY